MLPLFSIGHGSRKAAELTELLQRYGIRCLVDVRSHPYSRFHPQFNRKALETSLQAAGIRYVFMGDTLGGRPKDPDCYDAEGHIQYGLVRRTAFFKEGISGLLELMQQESPVAIMCSERDPRICHRSRLIGPALQEQGILLQHIDQQGRLLSQKALTGDGKDGQGSLF